MVGTNLTPNLEAALIACKFSLEMQRMPVTEIFDKNLDFLKGQDIVKLLYVNTDYSYYLGKGAKKLFHKVNFMFRIPFYFFYRVQLFYHF